MALDPKKRQKKLAKRKAQRKEKSKKLTALQQQQIAFESNRIAIAARYPIHQCMSNAAIFAGGMGSVLISRIAPDGDIVMCMFLLDTFCLGVKSAMSRVMAPYEYDSLIADIRNNEMMQAVEPSYARKLIEDCAAYAATIGFKPDPDYQKAKEIFGNIDASECTDQFTFGKNGKPFFMSGPMDSPLKRTQIILTLEKTCGIGNFEFVTPIGDSEIDFPADDDEFDDEDFELGDDEEEDDV
jgi:hypothetical protein